MCDDHDDQPPQGPASAWRNFTAGEEPLPRRLQLLLTNNWWKLRHGQSCCGHYGQPGC